LKQDGVLHDISYEIRNKTKNKSYKADKEILQLIREMNYFDFKIYNLAKKAVAV
jgi:hypothetical protein